MKRFYIAPEAELLKFQAAEAMADELDNGSSEYETTFGFENNDGNPWN